MQRQLKMPLSSVTVSTTSIAVLVPCEYEKREGTAARKGEDGWIRGLPVRVMHVREASSIAKLEKISEGDGHWVDYLKGVKLLLGLATGVVDDPLVRQAAYQLLTPHLGLDPQEPVHDRFESGYAMHLLAEALDSVRLTYWWTRPDRRGNKRLLLGLICPTLKVAAATRWLVSARLRICTHCGEVFMAQRKSQSACKGSCRESHRQARFKARKKMKEATAA